MQELPSRVAEEDAEDHPKHEIFWPPIQVAPEQLRFFKQWLGRHDGARAGRPTTGDRSIFYIADKAGGAHFRITVEKL